MSEPLVRSQKLKQHKTHMKYTILAYRSQDTTSEGCDYDTTEDTLSAAKKRARYCVSETFRESCEMSQRFGYAQVRKDGEIVFDCFSK